ncbi:MAG TPA: glutamate--tRNA ligase [Planctomycetota bacterium]
MPSARPVRVRFAPSPTGFLHVGGARTALFNWAFARSHGGAFLLRVEDTDHARNTAASLQSILDSMRWLGLDWDEGPEVGGDFGPYLQSERVAGHLQAAEELLAAGRLYRCFCSTERLTALREDQEANKRAYGYDGHCRSIAPAEAAARAAAGEAGALRFAMPRNEEIVVQDLVRGEVRFGGGEVEDWVAVRSNGEPTYNLVCALDDAAMRISHVLRGEEHLVNTPKQILVHRALGQEPPAWGHVPLILGQDGKKLSKRTGDTAIEDYRAKGYPPEAMFNFLCLLGFAIDDRTEIFGPAELVEHFDVGRLNKSGAIFDPEKLLWLCGEYLRATPVPELADRALPFFREAGQVAGEPTGEERAWLESAVAALRERVRIYSEFPAKAAFLFGMAAEPDAQAAKALADPDAAVQLEALAAALDAAPAFPPADFDAWIKAFAGERGVGMGKVMKPARAALAGALGGPPVGDILALLGRERALRRLRAALAGRRA